MRRLPFLLLTLLLLAGCAGAPAAAPSPGLTRYEATFLTLFDTVTTIKGYAADEAEFQAMAQEIHDGLLEYHQFYDIYNEYPGVVNLKTVNDAAGGPPVKVEQPILDLLLFCREVYTETEGRVNAAMGSVLSLWHEAREAGINDPEHAALPDRAALEEAALHTDFSAVVIDEAASTVYLADPEMRLDVGAIAKGYAVEQVCRQIEEEGFANASFSIGGNIRTLGWREGKEGENWVIGLEDPLNPSGDYLLTVGLHDTSMVTSGDYQRYYTVDGENYHHIIDPRTLMPARYVHAVSVITADSGYADALSTWLFLLPVEEGLELVESLDGVEAVWTALDGSQTESSGFSQYRND